MYHKEDLLDQLLEAGFHPIQVMRMLEDKMWPKVTPYMSQTKEEFYSQQLKKNEALNFMYSEAKYVSIDEANNLPEFKLPQGRESIKDGDKYDSDYWHDQQENV